MPETTHSVEASKSGMGHADLRWDLDIAESKKGITLADGLLLEWAEDKDKPMAVKPACRVSTTEEGRFIEITTPSASKWTRLAVPLRRPPDAAIVTVQVVLRLLGGGAEAPRKIDPMLARLRDPRGSWLEPITASRIKGKLSLSPNRWYSLTGAFSETSTNAEGVHSLLVNLPDGCRVQIARLDVDWHRHLAPVSGQDGALAILNPFGLTADAPEGEMDVSVGRSPALSAVSETLSHSPREPDGLAASLMMQAHQGAARELMATFLRLALPAQKVSDPGGEDMSDLLAQLVTLHLGPRTSFDFSPFEKIMLREVAKGLQNAGKWGPVQPIRVEFEADVSQDIRDRWLGLYQDWLALKPQDAGTGDLLLKIESDALPSLLSIPFASTCQKMHGGAEITAHVTRPQEQTNWRRQITGYVDDPVFDAVRVGTLIPDAGATGNAAPWVLAKVEAADRQKGREVAPEHAYALVVALDRADTSALTNVEKCLVFDSVEALRTAFPDPGTRLQRKPVVILGNASYPPDHLQRAVSLHWAYGGQNTVTRLDPVYNRLNGHLKLVPVAEPRLSPLALLRAVTVMPLCEIRNRALDQGIYQPLSGFCVATPAAPEMGDAQLARLQRSFRPEMQSAALHEYLSHHSVMDHEAYDGIDQIGNWALTPMVAPLLGQRQRVISDLRTFGAGSCVERAEGILEDLEAFRGDIYGLQDDIDRFLLNLSLQPEVIATLSYAGIERFGTHARHSKSVDDISSRLLLVLDEICVNQPDHVMVVFSILSAGLEAKDMSVALTVCAMQCQAADTGFIQAVAAAHRRYGSPVELSVLLMVLHRARPTKLTEPGILQCFAPLLQSNALPVIAMRVGDPLIRQIRMNASITGLVEAAVRDRDRDRALALLGDAGALQHVDLMRWMDGLRGLSNELKELALPVSAISLPEMAGLAYRKLAAVIFADRQVLKELEENDLLAVPDPQNVVARNILGDNTLLNSVIAQVFAQTPYRPFQVSGSTAPEVFRNAQTSISDAPVRPEGPLVSVIMSAYEPDLELMEIAVSSICSQTHGNVEILVVDDASSPEKAAGIDDILRRHDQARLIRLGTNSGPYIGRNLALAQSRGAFIAIHDADDWAHPQLFEAQLEILESTPEVRLVAGEHIRIDRFGHVQLERNFTIFGDGPMTSMFRREVFDEIGFFAKVRSRGDVEMRERLRDYYGYHAIKALKLPLKMSLADSDTLSQRTQADKSEQLQLWRMNISGRGSLASQRRRGVALDASQQLTVPRGLRAFVPEDME